MSSAASGPAAFAASAARAESRREAAYGEWESPFTPEFITASGVGLRKLAVAASTGRLFWLESRPEDAGRYVVVAHANGADARGSGVDAIPADHYARTRVHEYGGGEFLVAPDGSVIYSNFRDQRLYRVPAPPASAGADAGAGGGDGAAASPLPEELTPPSAFEQDGLYRFADGVLDAARNRLVCVREDHTDPSPAGVRNAIVAVALDGSGTMEVLVKGADFYAAPRLSPDGSSLAFITWDHPYMPWDATALHVVRLDAAGRPADEATTVAGGGADGADAASEVSVQQPAWSPAGELHFVSDRSGWWNLYKVPAALAANAASDLGAWAAAAVCLLPREADFCGSSPGWGFGQQGYAFVAGGNVVAVQGGRTLITLAADGSVVREQTHADGLPYAFSCVTPIPGGDCVYVLGASPSEPTGIYRWSLAGGSPAELLVSSVAAGATAVPPEYVSAPRAITFRTKPLPGSAIDHAHGHLYLPRNPDFAAPAGTLPPLLVKAHGGPTACARLAFNPGIQFWTSRGFAVLDVDYRGSTGYGTAYRRELRSAWGICDIDDVCAGAQHLVAEGVVDSTKLAIDGGSAGGYTTLGALAFRDVFSAGCSLYGVADLGALAADTHKFESRYLDNLVGRWPEDKSIYDERAPVNSCDSLSCPVLLLQGDEDKIVPPAQAEAMYAALKAKRIPCALRIYEGEQHGFRKAENIQDALHAELFFYGRVFGFSPAGNYEGFPIDHMEDAE